MLDSKRNSLDNQPTLTLTEEPTISEPSATTILMPMPALRRKLVSATRAPVKPTLKPTVKPTATPFLGPTAAGTLTPTAIPTFLPSAVPTLTATSELTLFPTEIPTSTLTSEPTPLPTEIPTSTPTAEPTLLPTEIPTLTPTALPTESPTLTPTTEPTLLPTAIPTSTPTAEPTLSPTAIPTSTPTSLPTELPSLFPTSAPIASPTKAPSTKTPTKSPTLKPTLSPTHAAIKVNIDVKGRVHNIFKLHASFLQNNEALDDMVQNFLVLHNSTRDEMNELRHSLVSYKNGLGPNTLWLFVAIDHLLQGLENEEKLQQVGLTELANNFHTESIRGGDNHVVTVSSALGSGNISHVIRDGANDITGIIGNQTFLGMTLVNITMNAAGSVSAMFTSVNTAFSNAIGASTLLIGKDITVSACDQYNNIIYPIYTTANPTSIIDSINGFLACSNWATNTHHHYITKTPGADCEHPSSALAFSRCKQLLGLNNLETHDEL